MANSSGIRTLNKSRPFVRLLDGYDLDHFRQRDWRSILRGSFDAFCTTSIVLSLLTVDVVAFWYLIDNDENVKFFAIALPTALAFMHLELTFIVLVMKRRTFNRAIDQLQALVDQRKVLHPPHLYFLTACFWYDHNKSPAGDFSFHRLYKLQAIIANL